MIELMFPKVLMLIRQFYQEIVLFAIIVFLGFLDKSFKFQPDVPNGYHEVLMMSLKIRILMMYTILLL